MSESGDDALLEQDGAYAACRGRGWQTNPYLRREQMPAATGESLGTWVRKHDAWQRGFERGTGVDEAEPDPAGSGATGR